MRTLQSREPTTTDSAPSSRRKEPRTSSCRTPYFLPGGTTGWHTHPGVLLLSLTADSGPIDWYDANCVKHVYQPGDSWTEGTTLHDVVNSSSLNAHIVVTYVIAKGMSKRIDQPAPACAAAFGLNQPRRSETTVLPNTYRRAVDPSYLCKLWFSGGTRRKCPAARWQTPGSDALTQLLGPHDVHSVLLRQFCSSTSFQEPIQWATWAKEGRGT